MSSDKNAVLGSDGINTGSGPGGRDTIADLIGQKTIDGKRIGGDIHTTVDTNGVIHNSGFTLNISKK